MRLMPDKGKTWRFTVLWVFYGAALILLTAANAAGAQESWNTDKQVRIEPSFFVGGGLDKVDLATTTTGETISISGGGGIGGALGLGYGLTSWLDVDLTAGYQSSDLSEKVVNMDGTFDRGFILGSLKFKIPVSGKSHVKLGGGFGYYLPGELDVDASAVPGGSHLVIEYDNALGFHVTGEYESLISSHWSAILGVKYYYVTYDASSVTDNGVPAPVFFLIDELRELGGSGVDFKLAFARYF